MLIDFKISVCFPFRFASHVALATCCSSCFTPIIVILAVDVPSPPSATVLAWSAVLARVVIAIVMETAMVTLISLG